MFVFNLGLDRYDVALSIPGSTPKIQRNQSSSAGAINIFVCQAKMEELGLTTQTYGLLKLKIAYVRAHARARNL